jgi:hypothetical protein
LRRLLLVGVLAVAIFRCSVSTAVGREVPSDPAGGRPVARAAGFFIPVVAALAVRAAAPVAARAGAGIVAGVVGSRPSRLWGPGR